MKRTSRRHAPAAPSSTGLTLATFLPYRLNVAAAAVSDGLARIYGERFGIGIPEWRILATLGEFGSLTATAIGAHSRMGKVKVSRAATALEGRGLLRRDRNDDDLREAFLSLTGEGRAMYDEIVPLAQAYAARLTEGLEPGERDALNRALDRLMRLGIETPPCHPRPERSRGEGDPDVVARGERSPSHPLRRG